MKRFDELIIFCENAIRQGKTREAAARLKVLNPHEVPREYRLPLASLSRRAGVVAMGGKLLSTMVHAHLRRGTMTVSAGELAEYSVFLLRSGATDEALRTLGKVNVEKAPEALLFQAFAYFAQWDYESAIPSLERYLSTSLSPYARAVGRVNLAAALVGAQHGVRAISELDDLIEFVRRNNFDRLLGNCLQLRATAAIELRNFANAKRDLKEAGARLGADQSFDVFRVAKWNAILSSLESETTDAIENFRGEAVRRLEWESVREADLYALRVNFKQDLFEHLYFGTPHPHYRQRISTYLQRDCSANAYRLGPEGAPCLDLKTGCILGTDVEVPGRKMVMALAALKRDFYRPITQGGLFAEIFPGDYYDIFSSPDRMHQILRRTRRWLETSKLPVRIVEHRGAYSFELSGEFAFLIPSQKVPGDNFELTHEKLKTLPFNKDYFTAKAAREKLGMPETTFRRFLSWAMENNFLHKFGAGTATIYRLQTPGSSESERAA